MIVLGIDPGPKLCGWALMDLSERAPYWKYGGADILGDIVGWAEMRRPDLVVVEKPAALHRAQANASIIDTAFAGGFAFGSLYEAGYECVTVSPPQVRASLIGVAKRGNQDAAIKAVLERLIVGRPKRWNDHMRDAAAAAIVGYRMFQRRAA